MKYYKPLDIPIWAIVASKSLAYFYEHRDEYVKKFRPEGASAFLANSEFDIFDKIPEINLMLESLNTSCTDVWFFEFGAYHEVTSTIHRDNTILDVRVLMPLLNCENTETRHYISTGTPLSVPGTGISIPEPNTCTEVSKFCLGDGPVLMRANEFHSIYVKENSNYPRISMLLNLKDDLNHLLI